MTGISLTETHLFSGLLFPPFFVFQEPFLALSTTYKPPGSKSKVLHRLSCATVGKTVSCAVEY